MSVSQDEIKIETPDVLDQESAEIKSEVMDYCSDNDFEFGNYSLAAPGVTNSRNSCKLENGSFNCRFCPYSAENENNLTLHLKIHESLTAEEPPYKCAQCSFETDEKPYLQKHLCIHSDKYYQCDHCEFVTKYKENLQKHSLRHKSSSRSKMYICDECEYESKDKSCLKKHMMTHKRLEDVTHFKCTHCNFVTKHQVSINNHILKIHHKDQIQKYKCPECDFDTYHKVSLKGHILTHREPGEVPMYKCPECSYETKNKQFLPKHMQRHLGNMSCPKCGKSISRRGMPLHLKSHESEEIKKKYKCKQCDYGTLYFGNMSRHLKIMHSDKKDIDYKFCPECPYKTFENARLKRHIKEIHSEEAPQFKCDHCDFTSKFNSCLKRHVETAHINTDPVVCPECHKPSANIYTLRIHMKIHKKEDEVKMFRCDHCSYKTRYSGAYKDHVKRHKPQDEVMQYHCTNCPFKSLSKQVMYDHMSELKNCISCPLCCYKAEQTANLRIHMSRIHKDELDSSELWDCTECDFTSFSREMMPLTRGRKLVQLASKMDEGRLNSLTAIQRNETKGTEPWEILAALEGNPFDYRKVAVIPPFVSPVKKREDQEEDEDLLLQLDPYSDSGSEYVPSRDASDSEFDDVKSRQVRKKSDNQISADSYSPASMNIGTPSTSQDITFVTAAHSPTLEYIEMNNSRDKVYQTLADSPASKGDEKPFTKNNNSLTRAANTIDNLSEDENVTKGITIENSQKKEGKWQRDKVHSCYYCNKLYTNNLPRHFRNVHAEEVEVKHIFSITDAKKRRERLSLLEKCGDFYHNCEVLSLRKGHLILARRPDGREIEFVTYNDYGPCPQCLGFFLKRHLWHHLKYSCLANKDDKEAPNEPQTSQSRSIMAESTALLNGILSKNASKEFVSNIIDKLTCGNISDVSKNDPLLVKFGSFLYEKYGNTQSELIRQSMRQLARLLIKVEEILKKTINLTDLLTPDNFDNIVLATKELCISYQESAARPKFQIPSLALKIGYSLKKCVAIERGQALRRGDLVRSKELLAFLSLLKLEWSVRVSSNAKATLESRKLNATHLLPLTNDLLKLREFLDLSMGRIKNVTKDTFSREHWVDLASLTLVRVILFNKRRSGEASKLTLQQYASRPSWDKQGREEIRNSLTNFEQKLASSLVLVEVIGKRGRRVPIILSQEVKSTLDFLVSSRVKAGVLCENPYMFAVPDTKASVLRGHECLRKWCTEAGLQAPELITGTRLRKYVATVCQIFDLTENEQDWLARHLGHDIRVHREFCRLQENAVELTKISRLLLAVDQGEAQSFAGKKLDDISIEDLPAISMDDDLVDQDSAVTMRGIIDSANESYSDNGTRTEAELRKKKVYKPKQRNPKLPWSQDEREVVLKEMRHFIKKGNLPGKKDCCDLIETYPILSKRKWTDIKFYIKNYLTKINKKSQI